MKGKADMGRGKRIRGGEFDVGLGAIWREVFYFLFRESKKSPEMEPEERVKVYD